MRHFDSMDMHYEVVRDGEYGWRAEAINYEGDGEVYVTIFSGPKAYERALEYSAWKNGALANSQAPQRAMTAR